VKNERRHLHGHLPKLRNVKRENGGENGGCPLRFTKIPLWAEKWWPNDVDKLTDMA